jgi:hypothetical protein
VVERSEAAKTRLLVDTSVHHSPATSPDLRHLTQLDTHRLSRDHHRASAGSIDDGIVDYGPQQDWHAFSGAGAPSALLDYQGPHADPVLVAEVDRVVDDLATLIGRPTAKRRLHLLKVATSQMARGWGPLEITTAMASSKLTAVRQLEKLMGETRVDASGKLDAWPCEASPSYVDGNPRSNGWTRGR